jgi:hypothetical protein
MAFLPCCWLHYTFVHMKTPHWHNAVEKQRVVRGGFQQRVSP